MKTDAVIQKNVMEELARDPFLDATGIGVAVKHGIVTLAGKVDTHSKKIKLEKAAKKVEGVKAVAMDIEVSSGSSGKPNDTEIAEAVLKALKWHTALQDEKVKVKVEDGYVTLEGEVEWEFQKNGARYMVENIKDVAGINNLINIKSTISSSDVRKKINAAFHRHANLDSHMIHVESEGSKVILTGKVRSYAEKNDAENAAWLTPGVSKVENRLEIENESYAH